jgi:Uma2 family endonuclease
MTATVKARPPIENGAVMSREEFHRFYAECEGLERVELIEGVVYMPSPVRIPQHERPVQLARRWLMAYADLHEGEIEAMDGGSLLLDDDNEPIPDLLLYRLHPDPFVDGYYVGAPPFILEVAASTYSRDLHQKRRAYERNGVREYLVWRPEERVLHWFDLVDGAYVERQPGADGIIESREFPGLRLDVPALLAGDRVRLLAAVRAG